MRSEDRKIYEIIEKEMKLSEKEIDEIFEKNKYLKVIIPLDLVQLMIFFEKYGITREEMGQIAKKNPYFLTESFERIRYIEKFLNLVGITDIRWMAVNHPTSMSINPIKIKDFINKNRAENKSDEEIKKMIMDDYEKYFENKQ